MIYATNTRSVTWAKMRLNLHHFGKDNNVKKTIKFIWFHFFFFQEVLLPFFNDEQI